MTDKQITIVVEPSVATRLAELAASRSRTVSEIVNEAIAEHLASHPLSRAELLDMARVIAVEDAALLKALAEA